MRLRVSKDRFSIKLLSILFSAFILQYNSVAQQSKTNGEIGLRQHCSSAEVLRTMMDENPENRTQVMSFEEKIEDFLQREANGERGFQSTYEIPTVVHVVHLDEPVGTGSNVSDSAVIDYISITNEQLSNGNGFGENTGIQLCLAKTDPNGNSTNGINRVSGTSIPNFVDYGVKSPGSNCVGADQVAVKSLSRWPYTSYYNVWVVHALCNGTTGFANFPGNFPDVDGTVIITSAVDWQYHALTHETGHYFSLYHTFEGQTSSCPSSLFGCGPNSGDCCDDTPIHTFDNVSAINPCTNQGIWDNSRYNHMSYNQDTDSLRFTADQVNRLHAALSIQPRSLLASSSGCNVISVEEQGKLNLAVFPNPASNYLNVSINNGQKVSYEIIDLRGGILQSDSFLNHEMIDLTGLDSGFYFLKVISEEASSTRQFFKL